MVTVLSAFATPMYTVDDAMPSPITVAEFVREAEEDYSSPITSNFVSRMPQCRQAINTYEEVINHFSRQTNS